MGFAPTFRLIGLKNISKKLAVAHPETPESPAMLRRHNRYVPNSNVS